MASSDLTDLSIHDTSPEYTRLFDIASYVVRHPLDSMIVRWNWKAAALSAILRASIYLGTYFFLKRGMAEAIGVTLSLSVFRFLFGGVNGAIIQAFRRVRPAWHAVLTVPILLAAFSHVIEYIVLTGYDAVFGTHGKTKAILASVVVSIISAIFNLFAMRRGVLIVKDETRQSFWRDLVRMPWLIFEFISFPLIWTYKRQKRKIRNARNPEEQES
jgi:hypothetical protein